MSIYRKRLRDIYINGQINYLDVLLGAKDFSDFSSRMYLLQKSSAATWNCWKAEAGCCGNQQPQGAAGS